MQDFSNNENLTNGRMDIPTSDPQYDPNWGFVGAEAGRKSEHIGLSLYTGWMYPTPETTGAPYFNLSAGCMVHPAERNDFATLASPIPLGFGDAQSQAALKAPTAAATAPAPVGNTFASDIPLGFGNAQDQATFTVPTPAVNSFACSIPGYYSVQQGQAIFTAPVAPATTPAPAVSSFASNIPLGYGHAQGQAASTSLGAGATTSAPAPAVNTFACTQSRCQASFKRDTDRIRHEASKHGVNGTLHFCQVLGCPKSLGAGYTRRDKLTEHMWKKHANLGFVKRAH
ncbi:uncharacterized protein LY89DRAFT_673954 [Mollisia scopiformis]|uniref:C2H2-type domain-containing protein n=1 Tax=Mollisia scopiformis TaxID=149040 RepID=A0A194WX56_MOLSC|nr:uncharacterized protein LY89DRAFT_673954 [Mollisia scopiformis]KUJ12172.1 hypothetical protein LY89DRAFT_673954 [Mollisia scopiformis]